MCIRPFSVWGTINYSSNITQFYILFGNITLFLNILSHITLFWRTTLILLIINYEWSKMLALPRFELAIFWLLVGVLNHWAVRPVGSSLCTNPTYTVMTHSNFLLCLWCMETFICRIYKLVFLNCISEYSHKCSILHYFCVWFISQST